MTAAESDLQSAARAVEERLETLFQLLEENGRRVEAVWRSELSEGRRPTTHSLHALDHHLQGQLRDNALLDGVGFIAAPGALGDAERHIEWWRRSNDEGPSRFVIDVDPRSENRYEYLQMPYFVEPARGRRRTVAGPYLDYLATHAYILTFGVPVMVDDVFVGVSGADIQMAGVERMLMPTLRHVGFRAALLNRDGRVVLANVPEATSGARLRPSEPTTVASRDEVVVGSPELGWRLRRLPG